MKVVNVCLGGSYNYGWGYQDNLLSKYQKLLGNEVTIITTRYVNEKNSERYTIIKSETKYDNGVKVIRLENGLGSIFTKIFRHYKGFYKTLEDEHPDFIFVHCLQFVDILVLCAYLKNNRINCVVDNHADYTNSAQSLAAKLLHKSLWRMCAKQINKYATKFYGVIPLRCDFLADMYGLPKNKIDLLVMGADDLLVKKGLLNIKKTKDKFNISKNDFLIFTGGKIDAHKTETINLMKAVNSIENKKIKLIIFGSVSKEVEETFVENLSEKIIWAGWKNQEEIYDIICASNLGVFPGRHSVIWEQTVACGVPCIFKDIENTHHVDIGGNCIFIKKVNEIEGSVREAIEKNNYNEMLARANTDKKNKFLYSNIALKSLEEYKTNSL